MGGGAGPAEAAPSPAWVARSVAMIRRTVTLLGPERCCLSFNGGKDSTVLLHLIREALPDEWRRLHFVYFEQPNEFREVLDFITATALAHSLEVRYYGGTFKQGLARLLEDTNAQCVFLGTRRNDPHGSGLERLDLTTETWPNCIRAHPILDWTYAQVWEYLDAGGHAVCELYAKGYTSLGSTKTTIPSAALQRPDGSYRHARELADGRLERANRVGVRQASPVGALLDVVAPVCPSGAVLAALVVGAAAGIAAAPRLGPSLGLC